MWKADVGGSYGLSHLSAHLCIGLLPNTVLRCPKISRKEPLSCRVRVKESWCEELSLYVLSLLLPFHPTPPFVDQVVGYPSSRTLCHWFLTLQQSMCLWIPGNESNENLQVQRWKLTLCHDKGQTKQRRPLFSFNTGRRRIRLKPLLGSRWLGRWVPQQRRGDPLPWFRWVGDGSRLKSSKGSSTEHTTASTRVARKQETAQYQGPNPVFYRNVTQPKNLDAFSSLWKVAPRPATCAPNCPMFMPVPVTACPPMPIL